MALKPIDQARPEERRQGMWDAMRKLGTFTIPDIWMETSVCKDSIRDYLVCLSAGKYVDCKRQTRSGPNACNTYTLIKGQQITDAPRLRRDGTQVTQGLSRENMWRTMRILKEFTAKDLAINASIEGHIVAESDAKDYTRALANAGYLAVLKKGKGSGGGQLTRYRFVPNRYTGPQAPMIQRVKAVYDPNLKQVVWTTAGGQI